jgi:hypothetical protein
MKREVETARAAYRLWDDDSTAGTVAAVLLVVVFFAWPLYRFWNTSRGGGR